MTAYSVFQYRLWAEMFAKKAHMSLDQPPAVAMFNREARQKGSSGQSDVIVSVIDKLCSALSPKQDKVCTTISPIKKAELILSNLVN